MIRGQLKGEGASNISHNVAVNRSMTPSNRFNSWPVEGVVCIIERMGDNNEVVS